MYEIIKVKDKIRVPPQRFGKGLDNAIVELTREAYEGIIDEDVGIIVAVVNAKKCGEGKIIVGDGAAYYETELELLVYKPAIQEIAEGSISETTEFGAFVSIGPMDGLVHVSQIMDEFIDYDAKSSFFIGKASKRKLEVTDSVLARIVTVSFKSTISDSKIGLTMRQPFLGKEAWIEDEIERKRKGKGKGEKEEKEEKKGKQEEKKPAKEKEK